MSSTCPDCGGKVQHVGMGIGECEDCDALVDPSGRTRRTLSGGSSANTSGSTGSSMSSQGGSEDADAARSEDDESPSPTHRCSVCGYSAAIATPHYRAPHWCRGECDCTRTFKRINGDDEE